MSLLVNRIDKNVLKKRLQEEDLLRRTLSFYRYTFIPDPVQLRDELYAKWSAMGCFGRVYIAAEGINAQMSVPDKSWEQFEKDLFSYSFFNQVPFKFAVDGNGKSFYKLILKVREKIVADGITDPDFDPAKTGNYLNAAAFNQAMEDPNTIVVDMRNHYESEVGRFDGAFCPNADTFREELPMVVDYLQGQEEKK